VEPLTNLRMVMQKNKKTEVVVKHTNYYHTVKNIIHFCTIL
jgi:hypothetical protein